MDLVTIATPSGMHFEHTADIIKDHKKDIVVEKPTFMTQKQMRDAYNLAKDNNCEFFPYIRIVIIRPSDALERQ